MSRITEERIGQIIARQEELSARMASGALEGAAFVQASKDYSELEPVVAAAREVGRLRAELASLDEMLGDGDAELKAMAEEEVAGTREALAGAEHDRQTVVLERRRPGQVGQGFLQQDRFQRRLGDDVLEIGRASCRERVSSPV